MTKSLIQIQEAAIAKLDVSRSSERRYAKLRGSVARWFDKEIAKIGYAPAEMNDHATRAQRNAMWQDVLDMFNLQRNAE